MSYKIVADSCCEFPEGYEKDSRYERVALRLDVEDEVFIDDESFDQAKFLKSVAKSAECPKSSCPSPEAFREAYRTDAENVFVFTLSSHLSGSYNSAELGKKLYHEKYGDKFLCAIQNLQAAGRPSWHSRLWNGRRRVVLLRRYAKGLRNTGIK